jgi:hypothetical protein
MNATSLRVPRLRISRLAAVTAPFFLAALALAETVVVINEFKADTPGPDTGEFLELSAHDAATGAAVPLAALDGYVVVFFNGAGTGNPAYLVTPVGGTATASLSLDGLTTNAFGFFVIGSPGVPGAGLELAPGASGWFQNGADGVGLYKHPATVFTAGTAATAADLVDAIVYGTEDPEDADLLAVLTPGGFQINETPNSGPALARVPDGGAPFASAAFVGQAPTPGSANQPVEALTIALSPSTVMEGLTREGTVTRSGGTAAAVTVTLTSSDPGEAGVPASLEIPAGASSVPVVIAGVDDLWPDGTQPVELTVTAPGYRPGSLAVVVTDNGDVAQPLVINEVFVTGEGDANEDGATGAVSDRSDDEFVEIVNRGAGEVDLGGYQLHTSSTGGLRHAFPAGTILASGSAVVVFGGGTPVLGISGAFGQAWIQTATAPGPGLALAEPGGRISLRTGSGQEVAGFVYDDQTAAPDSLTLDPDLTGNPVPHGSLGDGSIVFSPGTRVDGTPFAGPAADLAVTVAPSRVSENAGSGAATLTVRRPGPWTDPLVVTVRSQDPTEAVPAAVFLTIPAGEASASVPVHAIDDTAPDGPQTVAFTGTAAGHRNGSAVLEVVDDGRDTPPLGVFINEIDTDQPGADSREFIELYVGEPAAKALDGYIVVLFNGNHSANGAYAVFNLAGRSSNAGGIFVLGNAAVPNVDLVIPDASIQNGPDAVAIYRAAAASFTTAGSPSPPTFEHLVDLVVYGNASAGDPDLLAAFQNGGDPLWPPVLQHNEGDPNNATALARVPDATTAFGNHTAQTPTPGALNLPGLAVPPKIDISVNGGSLVLTFTGTLEQSSTLHAGSFAPVAGATSPHVIPLPAGGSRYFRAAAR